MRYSKSITIASLYAIMSVLTSCAVPVSPATNEITAAPDNPVPEEVKTMTIQPFKEYQAYAVSESGSIFGLIGKKREQIIFKDDQDQTVKPEAFSKSGDTVYFSIKTMEAGAIPDTDPVQYYAVEKFYYFSQTSGVITELEASDFPSVPESSRVEMGIAPFSIISGKYGDTDISTVSQEISETSKPKKAFLFVDGYFSISEGLWFSVPEGINGAEKGLYFWTVEAGGPSNVSEYGRIWN